MENVGNHAGMHGEYFVSFLEKIEFSPFFCGFQVAGVHAIDFLHKITPKWVISGRKFFVEFSQR